MMVERFDPGFGSPIVFDEDMDPPSSPSEWPPTRLDGPEETVDLAALNRLSVWGVVMKIVIVHADAATAAKAGLFGLLGDARVQVIVVDDEESTHAYYDLAEKHEQDVKVIVTQDFVRHGARYWKDRLETSIKKEFHSHRLVATFKPAIMFRLCSRRCNALHKKTKQYSDNPRAKGRVRPWLVG